jgi:hypothetical protein
MYNETFLVKLHGSNAIRKARFEVTSESYGSAWVDFNYDAIDYIGQAMLDFAEKKGFILGTMQKASLGRLGFRGCWIVIAKVKEISNET